MEPSSYECQKQQHSEWTKQISDLWTAKWIAHYPTTDLDLDLDLAANSNLAANLKIISQPLFPLYPVYLFPL
jgi:hypothetical protein